MKNRTQLLKDLMRAINTSENADCTLQQVDYWVGCNATRNDIAIYIEEVVNKSPCAVSYKDIQELWDER